MPERRVDVVVIGAGQAGLATSYCLARAGIDHVVLEKGSVGHAWVADRWDSFCLVTPNWTITLPGAAYEGPDPDGFMLRDDFVTYMRQWAASFDAPVETGVEVFAIGGDPGAFRLATSAGPIRARAVVVATGTYQTAKPQPVRARLGHDITQIAASVYRNPTALPNGAVLVVGSGQSGCQIAEELNEAGRAAFLCVARVGRLPRRYRGRDCIAWQREMGWLDRTPDMLEDPAQRFRGDPHLSGKNGGHTISLHELRRSGVTLLGRLVDADGGRMRFADDLAENVRFADDYAANFHRRVDEHIASRHLDAPGPTADDLRGGAAGPSAAIGAPSTVDVKERKIAVVIWATGFTYDFSWIRFPVRDRMGYPVTERGESPVAGLFFMGLNWMYKRKSGIIYGVGEDARHVASRITTHLDRRGR